MRSIESSLLGAPASAGDDASDPAVCPTDSESDTDELSELAVGPLGAEDRVGDWEHVPLSLPEVDVLVSSRNTSPSYFSDSQAATVTSIVSSAASAATSALSFWRGWGRGSDNNK